MIGYFLAGALGGFMLGTVAGLFLMSWLTAGSDADDMQEAWNAGYVAGMGHDKAMAEKMGRERS